MTYDDRLHRGCDEFLSQISELISGKASAALQERWEEHRLFCGECQEQWTHVKSLMSAWSQMPLRADPRSSWSGIRKELDQDYDQLARNLEPVFQEYRELPMQASTANTWRRLHRQARPRWRWSWARFLDLSALFVTSGWLLALLVRGNDAALRLALQWQPESVLLSRLAQTPWSNLFLPAAFLLFSGGIALISLPLIRRALQRESMLIAVDSGHCLQSESVA